MRELRACCNIVAVWERLFGGVAAIEQNGLAGHPPAFGHDKADIGGNILDFGQATGLKAERAAAVLW